MTDIYQEIVDIRNKGEDAALISIIATDGSTPRKTDAKMLVKADGSTCGTIGGGNLEMLCTVEAQKVIRRGRAKRLDYDLAAGGNAEMMCGGNTEVLIEPILAIPSLFICGGGHIGLALDKIGRMLGFKTIIIDDRPDYASKARFPEAEQCIVSEYVDVFKEIKVGWSGYIVIVTHGHKGDGAALISALDTQARYIGMIGSEKKVASTFDHLRRKGIAEEQIKRVHAPIGLPIYGQSPEEIAISIMAEIISVRWSPVKEQDLS